MEWPTKPRSLFPCRISTKQAGKTVLRERDSEVHEADMLADADVGGISHLE